MSSYFTLPSFARAKKNKEELEKAKPTQPILKEEDEHFLRKVASNQHQAAAVGDAAVEDSAADSTAQATSKEESDEKGRVDPVPISDDKSTPNEEPSSEEAIVDAGGAPPESEPPLSASKDFGQTQDGEVGEEPVVEPPSASKPDRKKKDKGIKLPSQEDAEKATSLMPAEESKPQQEAAGDKRTWTSYIQSLSNRPKKDGASEGKDDESHDGQEKQTWSQYASQYAQYVPSAPSLPSMPAVSLPAMPSSWSWSKDKDAQLSPVYKEDGTIDEEATKSKQEAEVSVLLDNMKASTINNRVFSISGPMEEYYHRFTQVLKDTLNGAPTAYEDMDKLMKDAGPQLQKQFDSMPPFVQTLVKSLPAKLGTTLGPELLAAASEKPGADAQARLAAANKSSVPGSPVLGTADTSSVKKQKKKTPALKKFVSEKGAVATALRNIVTFIQTRFPFLASATNVLMSLAVFILMLVFWYCHKRGREMRLAREAESGSNETADGEEEADEFDATDEEEIPVSDLDEKSGAEPAGVPGSASGQDDIRQEKADALADADSKQEPLATEGQKP